MVFRNRIALTDNKFRHLMRDRHRAVVAIGCTGGHHRSVAIAHKVAEFIVGEGYPVTENHRDISR